MRGRARACKGVQGRERGRARACKGVREGVREGVQGRARPRSHPMAWRRRAGILQAQITCHTGSRRTLVGDLVPLVNHGRDDLSASCSVLEQVGLVLSGVFDFADDVYESAP